MKRVNNKVGRIDIGFIGKLRHCVNNTLYSRCFHDKSIKLFRCAQHEKVALIERKYLVTPPC
jgi:hypothetical protein